MIVFETYSVMNEKDSKGVVISTVWMPAFENNYRPLSKTSQGLQR